MAAGHMNGLQPEEQTVMRESKLFKRLDDRGKRRYKEKLQLIGVYCDPYTAQCEEWKSEPDLWPNIEFADIYTYLIDSPSPHTKESLKAYKSTEAWGYFIAGYVSELGLMKANGEYCLIRAKASGLYDI